MKNLFPRATALGLTAAAFVTISGITAASADPFVIGVRIGNSAPPPPVVEHPWAAPSPNAVWIPGHYEWTGNQYVWVSGYYSYPPQPGFVWVPERYEHRDGVFYFHAGSWRGPHDHHDDHHDH